MAGILNNKERVMDFTITREGKRQAALGEMQFQFATFTDLHTFYETSGSAEIPDLAADASNRIFFETYDRYQDVIVPELEAGFSLRPFRTSDFDIIGGSLISGSISTGIMTHPNILSGSQMSSAIPRVLAGITQNFENQRIISTVDEFSFYHDIKISPVTGTFSITNSTKYLRAQNGEGSCELDKIPSIFSDRRFADFPNFKYLPPVNLPLPGMSTGTPLGNYPKLNETEIISIDDLENSLDAFSVVNFDFSETSRRNNIIVQFFEQDMGGVEKLSVIDFGEFSDDDPQSPGKRVFYVGKIMRDGTGAETFLCIFTVILD
jgi:hypothetical protein